MYINNNNFITRVLRKKFPRISVFGSKYHHIQTKSNKVWCSSWYFYLMRIKHHKYLLRLNKILILFFCFHKRQNYTFEFCKSVRNIDLTNFCWQKVLKVLGISLLNYIKILRNFYIFFSFPVTYLVYLSLNVFYLYVLVCFEFWI